MSYRNSKRYKRFRIIPNQEIRERLVSRVPESLQLSQHQQSLNGFKTNMQTSIAQDDPKPESRVAFYYPITFLIALDGDLFKSMT